MKWLYDLIVPPRALREIGKVKLSHEEVMRRVDLTVRRYFLDEIRAEVNAAQPLWRIINQRSS